MTKSIAARNEERNRRDHERALSEGLRAKLAWVGSHGGGGFRFFATVADAIAERDRLRVEKERATFDYKHEIPEEYEPMSTTMYVLEYSPSSRTWNDVEGTRIVYTIDWVKTAETRDREKRNAEREKRRNRPRRRS